MLKGNFSSRFEGRVYKPLGNLNDCSSGLSVQPVKVCIHYLEHMARFISGYLGSGYIIFYTWGRRR